MSTPKNPSPAEFSPPPRPADIDPLPSYMDPAWVNLARLNGPFDNYPDDAA